MDFQAQPSRLGGGGGQARQVLGRTRIAVPHGVAIGASVQLHHLGAHGLGCGHLIEISVDEAGDPDAGRGQPADHGRDIVVPLDQVQPAFRGHLLPALRHEARRMRQMAQGDGLHLGGHGHLEVQRAAPTLEDHGERIDVRVGNVPAVLPQVGGDAIGAGHEGELGGPHRVWIGRAPGVPDGRHMVDIDPQAQETHRFSLLEPGSCAGRAASSGGTSSGA